MAYYVYVLQSIKEGKQYVGYTKRSVDERLSEHNIKNNQWTSRYKQWKIVYYERFLCMKCARNREKILKSGYGRMFLRAIIKADIYKVNKCQG